MDRGHARPQEWGREWGLQEDIENCKNRDCFMSSGSKVCCSPKREVRTKMLSSTACGRLQALVSVIAIACVACTSAFSVGTPRSLASRPVLGSAVRQPGGGLAGLPLEAKATRVQGQHLRQREAPAAARTSRVNMAMDGQGSRVVIVGGGFGGLYTALNLAKLAPLQEEAKAKPDITLIDTSDRFAFLPLLYELVTGELKDWEVAPVFNDLLEGTGVKFVHGKVTERNAENKTVSVSLAAVAGAGEKVIEYDHLVVALGSQTTVSSVEGAEEHSIPFARAEDAKRLRERLDQVLASKGTASVVVVGGGYSGVELACNIADNFGSKTAVSLVHRGDKVMEPAEVYNRNSGARKLTSANVKAMMRTSIVRVDQDSITYQDSDGQEWDEPYDICVWTAGARASEMAQSLDFKTNSQGRITVTPRMQVKGEEGVYALGDIADCRDALMDEAAATAQVAMQQADCVAWNIHAGMTSGIPINFRYQKLGEMLTLGRSAASLASPLFGVNINGQPAHALRRIAYLIRMPATSHKVKVAGSWASRLPTDLLRIVAETSKIM